MHEQAINRLQIESGLKRALERGEFCVHYQPVVDLEAGRISGMEALVRWLHPDRGMLLPGEFIRIAEESGIIIAIGDVVLEQACKQL
ncbi:EAL domain-containing protein, partial [Klebsiella pneumoniae]|uniref:EAL domain-containing protein n=1 Tax=Klebsiella pneumoniae TaxID=573 RepID=UPI003975095F